MYWSFPQVGCTLHQGSGWCFVCAECSASCPFPSVTCLSPIQVLGDSCITPWTAVEGSFPERATLYLLLCPGHLVSPGGQGRWYPCLAMEWSRNSQSQLVSLGGVWVLMTSPCSLWAFSQGMLVRCWVFGWMATCSSPSGFSAERIGDAPQVPGAVVINGRNPRVGWDTIQSPGSLSCHCVQSLGEEISQSRFMCVCIVIGMVKKCS